VSPYFDRLESGTAGQRIDALRNRDESTDVSTLELFFDLVYVLAVSQISHLLLEDLTWRGALNAALIMLAVWWAWIDTTWITNWFDPRKMPVRLMLIVLMFLSLVMTAAIPAAFEDRASWFALCYVAIQVGRSAFCLFMLGQNEQAANFARITFWAVLSAPFWIAGAFSEGDTQLILWGVGALLDTAAPMVGFRVPFVGKSTSEQWTIEGGHLAERCQLFVIIALGESLLLAGSSLATTEHIEAPTAVAFGAAFLLSVLMWWVYFARAGRAVEIFEQSENPGAMGRVYTYFHMPMVAGIIILAVANEMLISHPEAEQSGAFATVLISGALLYLFGNAVFNSTVIGSFPWRRLSAAAAVLLAAPFYRSLTPLAMTIWVLIPFIALAVVDTLSQTPRDEEVELRC
jgi:low temperature requirement protein LtrA